MYFCRNFNMFIKKKLKYFTRLKQISPDLSGVAVCLVAFGLSGVPWESHFHIFPLNFLVLPNTAVKPAWNIDHNMLTCIWGKGHIEGQGHMGQGHQGFFLPILWRKFGYIPKGKSCLFFPIFAQKFQILKMGKSVVKLRFIEGLKQGKWFVIENASETLRREAWHRKGSKYNKITLSCLFIMNWT